MRDTVSLDARSAGFGPTIRVADIMQHSQNMYEITPHRVKQPIREARKKRPANTGNYLGIKQRRLL